MAITETLKSTFIGNRDATPTVSTLASIAGGRVKSAYGYVTTATTATTASYYPLVQVPSNCRIKNVILQCAALGAACTANVGVFVPTVTNTKLLALSANYTAGAAIDADFFASLVDVSSALGKTNITNESTTNTLVLQEKELWAALSLASDPGCNLDIAITLGAATVAGGLVSLEVDWVQ